MTYCQFITQALRIISVQCITLSLRSNKRRRATFLLPPCICSCWLWGTVNCAIPFAINVTILISISHTFRSRVALSHLRQAIVFSSHNSTDLPERSPLMNVLFWGRFHFPIGFAGRDIIVSRNLWNNLLWSYYGQCGDIIKRYEVSSPKYNMTFLMKTICSVTGTFHWDITPMYNVWPCYRTGFN